MCLHRKTNQKQQTCYGRRNYADSEFWVPYDIHSVSGCCENNYIAGEDMDCLRRKRGSICSNTRSANHRYRRRRSLDLSSVRLALFGARLICTWQLPLSIRRESKADSYAYNYGPSYRHERQDKQQLQPQRIPPSPEQQLHTQPRNRSWTRGDAAEDGARNVRRRHAGSRPRTVAGTVTEYQYHPKDMYAGHPVPVYPLATPQYDYFATQDSQEYYGSYQFHERRHREYGFDNAILGEPHLPRPRPNTIIASTPIMTSSNSTDSAPPPPLPLTSNLDAPYNPPAGIDLSDHLSGLSDSESQLYNHPTTVVPRLHLTIPETNQENFIAPSPQRRKTDPQPSAPQRMQSLTSRFSPLSAPILDWQSARTFDDDRDRSLFAEALSGFSDEFATISEEVRNGDDDDDDDDDAADEPNPQPPRTPAGEMDEILVQALTPPPLHRGKILKQRKSRERERQRAMFAEAIHGLWFDEDVPAGEARA